MGRISILPIELRPLFVLVVNTGNDWLQGGAGTAYPIRGIFWVRESIDKCWYPKVMPTFPDFSLKSSPVVY